ncbi:MAG: hypothetical protein JXQ90_08115 [Cyclobacteriaceae bacterium]
MSIEIYICEEVENIRRLFNPVLESYPQPQKITQYLQELIELMSLGYMKGDHSLAVLMSNHHPDLIGESSYKIMSEKFIQQDYQSVILFDHGFSTWAEAEDAGNLNIPFETAVTSLVNGDQQKLAALLDEHPEIIHQQSSFGHKAGLIHYIAANGVEIWRQSVPMNATYLVELLLEKGADPHQQNNIYGGSSMVSLIESSDHPNMAGVADDLISLIS